MWKRVVFVAGLLGLMLITAWPSTARSHITAADPTYRPGVVLVQFAEAAKAAQRADVLAETGLQPGRAITSLRIVSVDVPQGRELAVAEELRRLPEIIFAEPDYRATAAGIPDDPDFPLQWSLTKIGAPAAWGVVTETADVVIAIVDSGMAPNHPDLAPKLWVNPDEASGNRLDDDDNGKIDDTHGWHFYQRWTGTDYEPAEDANIADDCGHGTHVAGIAAAATDNGIGVAGLAWSSPIMPVKVLDKYGNGWYSDIASGIVYAADNGAKIINLSLGGQPASDTLCAATAYAHARGALLVAAAGNHAESVFYPAACDYVMAVAGTDSDDNRMEISNYGSQIDVAAPGDDIYSTWYSTGTNVPSYFSRSGTSMAVPHVSGVAALVWSLWPGWSNDAVRQQILDTAVDLGPRGWDAYTGWGRVDAAAAVGAAEVTPTPMWTVTPSLTVMPMSTMSPTPTSTPSATGVGSGSATPTPTATATPANPLQKRRYLPFLCYPECAPGAGALGTERMLRDRWCHAVARIQG